ncbi:PLC-like phosphodiesterase [Piedraia hortae CBS 480.64]|uniref:PLC-like phosphodiesterase n=1 Tax=Piedraia hortae CBS 480.64 TaxID=1314780 RepID=A0A6A7C5R1_9PEZI|nr:PLC-like phosphodiesterase [Piedraia hortae CBS 480.64]
MASALVIRNLTAQPLTIKVVERHDKPVTTPNGSLSRFGSNVTSLFNKSPSPEQTFATQNVDVRMEPFTTNVTPIQTTANSILRLMLQGEGGGQWRLETPTPSAASHPLEPLTPDPKHSYSAIYFPSLAFVFLFENMNLRCWMKEFRDDTLVSTLSIPGTHNSPTCFKALPSVRCQAVSPRAQLDNGVRFFDIRVQPDKPQDPSNHDLLLVHGVFPISLTGPKKFRALVNDILEFLRANPSETLIMSLKREGTGDATDEQLSAILKEHYANTPEWWTQPRMPTLGEARGKIILLRRFVVAEPLKHEWDGQGWGLKAINWAYNTPNCVCDDVCVQDFCEVLETENIDKKIQFCCEQLERSGACFCTAPVGSPDNPNKFYLNFLSASNFWKVGCWPEKIAEKLNPAVVAFLCQKHALGDDALNAPGKPMPGDGSAGIVVTDWIGKNGDWDLAKCIITMNSRILLRQRGIGWR